MIKIGIVGSRSRNSSKDKALLKSLLVRQLKRGKDFHLVSGGCYAGADKFAEELAVELGLGISIHKPEAEPGCTRWEYARAAYERNLIIAQECDILLAVWDGVSGGTKDTINKAEKLGRTVVIV
jgi:predicted Rossmann fold nucleotide-binding protein DprA/Smf involved in DNA uptake